MSKHKIVLVGPIIFFLAGVLVSGGIFWLSVYFRGQGSGMGVRVAWLAVSLVVLLFVIIRLFLSYVNYYTNLVVIDSLHITLISAKLFIRDNTEIFDLDEITKMLVEKRWLICNIFNFWTVLMEGKNDDIKVLKNIPNPHRFVKIFEKNKNKDVKHQAGIFSA